MWPVIIVGIAILFFIVLGRPTEGFSYNENPCGAFDSCRACADAAGCGWCPDLGQCQPMAQDGFPMRTTDLTTGNPDVSPYLIQGVLPVVSSCPLHCKISDLGDCDCTRRDPNNSCAPECYAVYGQGCVCPNDGLGSVPANDEEKDIVKKLASAQTNVNKLLKSTRIHICSPHGFVIDSAKC